MHVYRQVGGIFVPGKRRGRPLLFTISCGRIPVDHDLPLPDDLAIKLLCVVAYFDGEGFFVAIELEIIRYSPRVPARAVSAKGHHALGYFIAVGSRDDHFGIE
jgi:hypothetical protein